MRTTEFHREEFLSRQVIVHRTAGYLFAEFVLKLLSANMSTTSSDLKSLFEIKRFEGSGFDLWKERMLGILFLKDCEGALLEVKPM